MSELPRPGSGQDLSQRMDRMEQRHEELAREVSMLGSTVSRIELNQGHQTELNKLRFDALDVSVKSVDANLDAFMARINAILMGEVKLPQATEAEALVEDYRDWRATVEDRLKAQEVIVGQLRLIGRIAAILVGGNALAILGAIAWVISWHPV